MNLFTGETRGNSSCPHGPAWTLELRPLTKTGSRSQQVLSKNNLPPKGYYFQAKKKNKNWKKRGKSIKLTLAGTTSLRLTSSMVIPYVWSPTSMEKQSPSAAFKDPRNRQWEVVSGATDLKTESWKSCLPEPRNVACSKPGKPISRLLPMSSNVCLAPCPICLVNIVGIVNTCTCCSTFVATVYSSLGRSGKLPLWTHLYVYVTIKGK